MQKNPDSRPETTADNNYSAGFFDAKKSRQPLQLPGTKLIPEILFPSVICAFICFCTYPSSISAHLFHCVGLADDEFLGCAVVCGYHVDAGKEGGVVSVAVGFAHKALYGVAGGVYQPETYTVVTGDQYVAAFGTD